jgi:hypothetical protein
VRDALPQPCHPGLKLLLFNEALSRAIDATSQSLAELADLPIQGGTLLPRFLSSGVEASGTRLGQAFRMRQEGPHVLPHLQREAIRLHLGVGAETLAAKAIGIRANPVIGIGPGPTLPSAGTQGFAVAE